MTNNMKDLDKKAKRAVELTTEEFKKEISACELNCYDNSQLCDILHLIRQLAEKVEQQKTQIEDLDYELRQIKG